MLGDSEHVRFPGQFRCSTFAIPGHPTGMLVMVKVCEDPLGQNQLIEPAFSQIKSRRSGLIATTCVPTCVYRVPPRFLDYLPVCLPVCLPPQRCGGRLFGKWGTLMLRRPLVEIFIATCVGLMQAMHSWRPWKMLETTVQSKPNLFSASALVRNGLSAPPLELRMREIEAPLMQQAQACFRVCLLTRKPQFESSRHSQNVRNCWRGRRQEQDVFCLAALFLSRWIH